MRWASTYILAISIASVGLPRETVTASPPPRPVPASSPILFAEFWPDRPVWTSLASPDGPDLILATSAGGPVRIRGEVARSEPPPEPATKSERPAAAGILGMVTESPLADLSFARGLTLDLRGDGRAYRVVLEFESLGETPPSESAATPRTIPARVWHAIEIRPPAGRWTRFMLPFDAFRPIAGDPSGPIHLPEGSMLATPSTAAPEGAPRRRLLRFGAAVDRTQPGRFRLEITRVALLDPNRTIEDDVEPTGPAMPRP